MLFTHFGISGPLVLSASAHMAELAPEDVELLLDLKPGLTAQQLDARLLRELDASGKRQLHTLLDHAVSRQSGGGDAARSAASPRKRPPARSPGSSAPGWFRPARSCPFPWTEPGL